ncbi:PIN domain-containing protein [Alteraurantiacibacter buctensis]|uniref:PIN domain-containing protein n=1 Tax=Alteraurantiacibacter buctensis TaxID=1503981 RepID=A0A844Z2Z0_9SPHN|nr:PIN domain-containing protein [Alteraurantiacibacter buctensis]
MSAVYWDSVCFLGWLQDELDKVDSCREVLDECEAGRLMIVTSALTLAEVLAMRGKPRVPTTDLGKVEAFFKRSYIDVHSVTRKTAEDARQLVWHHNVAPKDAIHMATALRLGMDELHTFDGPLIDQSGLHGTPTLIIRKPSIAQPKLKLVGGIH